MCAMLTAQQFLACEATTSEANEKLNDYRAAGTLLLWVVDPAKRLVAVYAADAPTRWFRSGDTFDGGDIIPGFTITVDALFDGAAEGCGQGPSGFRVLVPQPPVRHQVPRHVVPHRLA